MQTFNPRPYQSRILDELKDEPAIALFMGTGTGKTLTSLFRFKKNPTSKLLIICPKKVVTQWEDVITNFDPTLTILQFKKSANASVKNQTIASESADIIIVNFEIIHKLPALLTVVDHKWTVIVDESHKIKELGTRKSPVKVTKAVLTIGLLTPYKIILTATPTQKSYGGYIDYFTQLKFLGKMPMNLTDFKKKYVIEKDLVLPGRPYPIKEIIGYFRSNEIDSILHQVARRYVPKKGDFDPEHIKVKIDRASSYARTKREMVYENILLDNVSRKRIALKTLTSGTISGYDEFRTNFKFEDNTNKIDWLEEFLSNTDETIVIYYQYNSELADLQKLMDKLNKKTVVINGATQDKYQAIKTNYDVLLGQYQAAAESLDGLQHKSHIAIFYSMPESSLLYKQALGRIDRIGQVKVPIYYYLVMEKTIDETIYDMIEKKIEFSEQVLDRLLMEDKI
jgi:superfamily II DNA or RNA helicase